MYSMIRSVSLRSLRLDTENTFIGDEFLADDVLCYHELTQRAAMMEDH